MEDNYIRDISNSNWLSYIRSILVASLNITTMIHSEHNSVLIHCSDGWDRTSQLCALSQVMLDPYFRTIKGLAVLIEKDWISFGHKFAERYGHAKHDPHNDQRSPVFIQFLDCVWQILRQFPNSFEYTSELLSYVAYHTTSGLYGTFLADNECERNILYQLPFKTPSIWNFIFQKVCKQRWDKNVSLGFLNENYIEFEDVLFLDHRMINLKIWKYHQKLNPFSSEFLMEEREQSEMCMEKLVEKDMKLVQMRVEMEKMKHEMKCLKERNNSLLEIKWKYNKLMKYMENENGFLLKGETPVFPGLDYVSIKASNKKSRKRISTHTGIDSRQAKIVKEQCKKRPKSAQSRKRFQYPSKS